MKVVIVRRERGIALSMDVYADNLVAQLKVIHPDWDIVQIAPEPWSQDPNLWQSGTGLRKYYERLWRHPQAVSRLESDIFHIIDHSNAHVAYWLKGKGCKIVVTCHDLVQFVYPEILNDRARFPALSMASWKYSVRGMKSADRVITVSNHTAKDVHELLAIEQHQITAIPNGVDADFCPLPSAEVAAIRQQYQGSSQAFCLLNVGSSHQRKNIPTILNALLRLRDRGVAVELWKVGEEFTAPQAAFIKVHHLDSIVKVLGKPDRATLQQIYNAADALIAPSLYEGFGLTILEAMACGTPVISANVSSLPEVAGDAAILVEPMDVEGIVAAVCDLKHNAIDRQNWSDKGLARAKQFTWTHTAEQVALVYEQLTF